MLVLTVHLGRVTLLPREERIVTWLASHRVAAGVPLAILGAAFGEYREIVPMPAQPTNVLRANAAPTRTQALSPPSTRVVRRASDSGQAATAKGAGAIAVSVGGPVEVKVEK